MIDQLIVKMPKIIVCCSSLYKMHKPYKHKPPSFPPMNLAAKWSTSWCTLILLCFCYDSHTHTRARKQVSWHRFHIHLRLYVVVRVGVGGWGHLSTAAAMRARVSDVIGGWGWRLPWFPSPISAADLLLAMPGLGNTETVQPRSSDSRLVVRLN